MRSTSTTCVESDSESQSSRRRGRQGLLPRPPGREGQAAGDPLLREGRQRLTIAQRFSAGSPRQTHQLSPFRDERTARQLLPSLRDYSFFPHLHPALKRWAIFPAFPFTTRCVKQPDKHGKSRVSSAEQIGMDRRLSWGPQRMHENLCGHSFSPAGRGVRSCASIPARVPVRRTTPPLRGERRFAGDRLQPRGAG